MSSFNSNSDVSPSIWQNVSENPPDKVLKLTAMYKEDTDPRKVNLGVGAYRDGEGKPWVLESVLEAERRITADKKDKEYCPISGVAEFVKLSMEFAYGDDCRALKEGRIAAVQAISGTGACRLGGELVAKFHPNKTVYIPDPTWVNHINIFKDSGLSVAFYRYYDYVNKKLNIDGMKTDLLNAENGSVILIHSCAHNPTGCDPSEGQWKELSTLIKEKHHIVLFDNAYQGFASGNPEKDAYAFRMFVNEGHNIMLSQSYAKNFGLYGERIGTFSVVTSSKNEAKCVLSQLNSIIRPMYSSPPIHGALIVATILSDADLTSLWFTECKRMADRIALMRTLLREKLEAATGSSWQHITDQIGMFCYTGLTIDQVLKLREIYHIYGTEDGRFSMAGFNESNVDYVAKSVAAVM